MLNEYNIVYASDNSFAPIMGTSIYSLLINNTDAKRINVSILDSGIDKTNKNNINRIFEEFDNAVLKWISVDSISNKIGIEVQNDRGSFSQYSRLFIDDVLNKNVNRVLYLDCDTVITSSIRELWNIDLQNKVVGAFKDAFSEYYRKVINLAKNDIMFNSGVMLINLKKWRELKIKNKILKYIIYNNGKVQQGDQGALNAILSSNVVPLDPKYNFVSILCELSFDELKHYRKPVNFYTKSTIDKAKLCPVIIHYTSSFYSIRPWFSNSNHPLREYWKSYFDKTPWKDEQLPYENRKWINYLFYHGLRKPILYCAGIAQIYLRPLKNYLTRKQ
ncbi:glycosyltransferase family 8 protein [Limosilactobacillus reuteri subsp. suis]|uniref:glycosyltransferase family 8 protein n=1 Tax=Limosilactobacillus reuteri TaxID=1598 RepID=UPI003992ACD5